MFQDDLVFVHQFHLLMITAEVDFVFLHGAVVVHPSPADSLLPKLRFWISRGAFVCNYASFTSMRRLPTKARLI